MTYFLLRTNWMFPYFLRYTDVTVILQVVVLKNKITTYKIPFVFVITEPSVAIRMVLDIGLEPKYNSESIAKYFTNKCVAFK